MLAGTSIFPFHGDVVFVVIDFEGRTGPRNSVAEFGISIWKNPHNQKPTCARVDNANYEIPPSITLSKNTATFGQPKGCNGRAGVHGIFNSEFHDG